MDDLIFELEMIDKDMIKALGTQLFALRNQP